MHINAENVETLSQLADEFTAQRGEAKVAIGVDSDLKLGPAL